MIENKQQNDTTKSSKWKVQTFARILTLLFTAILVLAFIRALLTGYLSWIGIAVGAFFVVGFATPAVLSFTRRKPLKPSLDRIWIGAFTIIVAAMMAVAFFWPEGDSAWRPYRFDDELVAIEFKRLVPDGDNAALHYESVFAKIDVNDRPDFFKELWKQPWTSNDFPEASNWLDAHSETIDELLLISRIEKCRWPVQADSYDDYTVPYKSLEYCGQILRVVVSRDLGEGRLHNAMEKSFCLLRMAQHLYQQTTSLDFYYGTAYETTALQKIRLALVQNNLSQEDMERIAENLLSTADHGLQDWPGFLESEKLRYMNLMARVYEVNDDGDVRFVAGFALHKDEELQKPQPRKDRLWRIYHLINMPLDPKAVQGIADKYFAKFDYLLKPDYILQTDDVQELSFWSPGSLSKLFCNFQRWAIEELALFDKEEYVRLRYHHLRQIIQRRGTWLVIGLRKYKNSHGHWPQTLDLISQYVPKEAFIDPINNGYFVYKLTDENFTLYSKGKNGIDEGGRWGYVRALDKNEDDIAIWLLTNQEAGDLDND